MAEHLSQATQVRIRDYVQSIGAFTLDELVEALGFSRVTVTKCLKHFEARGTIRLVGKVMTGRQGRPPSLYEFAHPTRHRHDLLVIPRRGSGVRVSAGLSTGRRAPRVKNEVRPLLEAAQRAGAEIRKGGTGHFLITQNGQTCSVPSTPSGGKRSIENARAQLKRIGVT